MILKHGPGISKRFFTLVAFSLLVSVAKSHADKSSHPLITPYPKSDIRKIRQWDYQPIALAIGIPISKTEYPSIDLVGDVFTHKEEIQNVSSLKVYENYKSAALNAGFQIVFECKMDQCGSKDQAKWLGRITNQNSYIDTEYPHYLVLKKTSNKGPVHIAWFIGSEKDTTEVAQIIVESESLETGLVNVDLNALTTNNVPLRSVELDEKEKAKDNPLLPRYPGAKLINYEFLESDNYAISLPNGNLDYKIQEGVGDISRHYYSVHHVSILKVFENYRKALTDAGFNIIATCKKEQCKNSRELTMSISPTTGIGNGYRNANYLVAEKLIADGGKTYIAILVGGINDETSVYHTITKDNAATTGLITINESILKQQLDEKGKALVYGIYFDTGKHTIKPESKPALNAISELLRNNPKINLYVVGHTDDTGELSSNMRLSKARATAVVQELTETYNVEERRLQPFGAGPYAPETTNTSDEGRQKNRRVELVQRLGNAKAP